MNELVEPLLSFDADADVNWLIWFDSTRLNLIERSINQKGLVMLARTSVCASVCRHAERRTQKWGRNASSRDTTRPDDRHRKMNDDKLVWFKTTSFQIRPTNSDLRKHPTYGPHTCLQKKKKDTHQMALAQFLLLYLFFIMFFNYNMCTSVTFFIIFKIWLITEMHIQ